MNRKMMKIISLLLVCSFFPFLIISCSGIKNILGWPEKSTGDNQNNNLAQFASRIRPAQGNPGAHYLLASYYQERGKHKEALDEFNKTLLIDPYYVKAYNGIGVSYDLLGDFSRAIEYYNLALKLDPNLEYVYNNLGYSYLLMGNLDDAITALKKAIAINDRDPRFRNNLGLAYGEKGQYDLALTEFKLANDEAKAHYNMAQLYFSKSLFDEAKSHYAIALKINPTLTVARSALKAADSLAKIFERVPSKAEPKQLVIPDRLVMKEDEVEKIALSHPSVRSVGKAESDEPMPSGELKRAIPKDEQLMTAGRIDANKKVSEKLVTPLQPDNVSAPAAFQKTERGANRGLYKLQIASFRSKEKAMLAARSIRKLGYETNVLSWKNGNNNLLWYRLTMGPFETSVEASTYKDKIAKEYQLNPLILKTTNEGPESEKISDIEQIGEEKRPSPLKGIGIEISNGNGVYRMAKKVGEYLKEKGLMVTRLTNANNFNHSETKVFYRKGYGEAADRVAEQITVVKSKEQTEKFDRPNIKIKILIGKDLVPHKKTFENGKNS